MHTNKDTKSTLLNVDLQGSDTSPRHQLSDAEAENRLQQAARILVNGAIRAAQKQKAAKEEPAQKTSKSVPSSMSGNQTFTDNSSKNVQGLQQRRQVRSHILTAWMKQKSY